MARLCVCVYVYECMCVCVYVYECVCVSICIHACPTHVCLFGVRMQCISNVSVYEIVYVYVHVFLCGVCMCW